MIRLSGHSPNPEHRNTHLALEIVDFVELPEALLADLLARHDLPLGQVDPQDVLQPRRDRHAALGRLRRAEHLGVDAVERRRAQLLGHPAADQTDLTNSEG